MKIKIRRSIIPNSNETTLKLFVYDHYDPTGKEFTGNSLHHQVRNLLGVESEGNSIFEIPETLNDERLMLKEGIQYIKIPISYKGFKKDFEFVNIRSEDSLDKAYKKIQERIDKVSLWTREIDELVFKNFEEKDFEL